MLLDRIKISQKSVLFMARATDLVSVKNFSIRKISPEVLAKYWVIPGTGTDEIVTLLQKGLLSG
jgi:hypothetical protein